jgi:hypothetical protein
VHGEQALGELGDHADRDAAAPQEGPRPALGAHRPGEDQAAVVVGVGTGVGGALPRRGIRGQHEAALDPGPAGCAHAPRVGPPAEQQRETGDDHRLSGAGLTGDDRQAAPQLEGDVVDRPETADAQLGELAR